MKNQQLLFDLPAPSQFDDAGNPEFSLQDLLIYFSKLYGVSLEKLGEDIQDILGLDLEDILKGYKIDGKLRSH